MLKPMLTALNKICTLTAEDYALLNEFEQFASVVELKKGEHLFKAGEIPSIEAFVVSGMLRRYLVDSRENERITQFYHTEEFIYDCKSYVNKEPIDYGIQAIEPSTLIVVDLEDAFYIERTFPSFERIGMKMMESFLHHQQEHLTILLKYTPEERYQYVLKHKPEWIQRISVTHLSQFLGLSRETLSRLRARYMESSIL